MKRKYIIILCLSISIIFLFAVILNNIFHNKKMEQDEKSSYEVIGEVTKQSSINDRYEIFNSNIDKKEDEQYEEMVEEYEYIYVELTEEEMKCIDKVIRDYYMYINRKIIKYVQCDSTYHPTRRYEGYNADELVIFEVIVEDSEIPRSIVIGSKDGWNYCKVLNEGY